MLHMCLDRRCAQTRIAVCLVHLPLTFKNSGQHGHALPILNHCHVGNACHLKSFESAMCEPRFGQQV